MKPLHKTVFDKKSLLAVLFCSIFLVGLFIGQSWSTSSTTVSPTNIVLNDQLNSSLNVSSLYLNQTWQNGQNRTDLIANPIGPPSIIIDISGSTSRQINQTTGQVDGQNTNASSLTVNALGNLTVSRTWMETVKLKGNFSFSGYVTVPSYTAIDLEGSLITEVTPHLPFFWLASGTHDVTIKGGYLNAQKELNGPPLTTTVSQNESSIYTVGSNYNLNFLDMAINGSINHGISILTNSYNVLIQGCSINQSYNDGVNFGAVHDSRIIGNQFYYQGHVPIVLTTSYRNTIANNVALYFGQRATFSGIHVFTQSYFNTIVGNVVGYGNGSGAHGIYINGYQNTISDNICTNLGSAYGIYLNDASENIVTANIVNGTSGKGIALVADASGTDYNNLVGNNFVNGSQDGIFIQSNGGAVYQNTISANVVKKSSRYGIYVLGATGTTYTYITNNDISNNTSTGIRLEPGNFTYMTGNTIFGNGGWGIHIVAVTSGNNYIKNNVITNNTSGAISNAGTATIIQFNVGYVTENSGSTANCINGTWIPTGLAGKENGAVTLKVNGTRLINATCYVLDPTIIAENSTHVQIEFLNNNAGTFVAVTATETKTIQWYFEYKP